MDDREANWLVGSVVALAVCIMLHGLVIAKLRRDVEFAVVLAERRMTDV